MNEVQSVDVDQRERNRAIQAEIYGEPMANLVPRIGMALGLTQARMAETLGMSAPMLSQLVSAQRVKMGNPAAVHRLQALADLSVEVTEGQITPTDAAGRIAAIKGETGVLTRSPTGSPSVGALDVRSSVRVVQGLLRAVSSASDLAVAADLLEADHGELAEVIRVYGTGRTEQAYAHYQSIEHLV